jgi:hypothetical protein
MVALATRELMAETAEIGSGSLILQSVAVRTSDRVAVTVAVKRLLRPGNGSSAGLSAAPKMASDQGKRARETGEGGGTRTHDTRIKSPLLYRLSYTPRRF